MADNFLKLDFVSKIHDFVRTKIADGIQNTPKMVPGHVSKILPNDFIEFTIDAIGPYTLPKLQIPQMFSKYHREPTQVGDKGIVVAGSYFIGGSSGQDGSTANLYPKGNLTTGSYQPVSNKNFPQRDPNMFLVTAGPSGHTTQSADTKTKAVIDNNNNYNVTASNQPKTAKITHIADKDITQTSNAGNIIQTAELGNVSHNAPQGDIILTALNSISAIAQNVGFGGFSSIGGGATGISGLSITSSATNNNSLTGKTINIASTNGNITITVVNGDIYINVPAGHKLYLGGSGPGDTYSPASTSGGASTKVSIKV